jgi:hypothetical protein
MDNQVSVEAKCVMLIDCLETNYPCTGNCHAQCRNTVGANAVVDVCATALITAACN